MPILKVFTNVQRSGIPKDFGNKILPVLAKTLNKPIEKFTISITPDAIQTVKMDSSAPSVVASLESIGHLGPEENKLIAKTITEFLENTLGVNKDRIVLTLYDLQPFNVASGGNTIG